MLTQCPGCQTVFRVTSTILRAAHGQVRCGRCNHQFDAIEQLLDGEEPQVEAAPSETQPSTAGSKPVEYEAAALSHEEIVLEGTRIEISGIYRRVEDDEHTDNPVHARTIVEEFNSGAEDWVLPFNQDEEAGQQPLQTDDRTATTDDLDEADTEVEDVEQELAEASLAEAIASLDAQSLQEQQRNLNTDQFTLAAIGQLSSRNAHIAASNLPDELPGNVSGDPAGNRANDQDSDAIAPDAAPFTTEQTSSRSSHSLHDLLDKPDLDQSPELLLSQPAPALRWPWAVASGVLALLLIAQVLHHSRATLARHPSFGPQLTRLYAALGQPLSPQWQLQAYSIKQWGIVSDPQTTGTLRVRASVTNGAAFAQPYPWLQLSLEDRFGAQVGARSFKPEEYLGNASQATHLLAAGESANVDLAIVDPGADAVGFQFDSCLPVSAGMQCAHDLLTAP